MPRAIAPTLRFGTAERRDDGGATIRFAGIPPIFEQPLDWLGRQGVVGVQALGANEAQPGLLFRNVQSCQNLRKRPGMVGSEAHYIATVTQQ